MTNLNDIISTFSKEEQQAFITYLEKKNKRKDIKNVQLFKLLIDNNLNSKDIILKLYNSNKENAYHALRKRLYQSIIDFTANSSLEEENSIDMQIIKLVLASRTFLLHKQYKVAYKTLDKAEKLAKEHHLFSLLNEIYHTQIQYAHSQPNTDLSLITSRFKENQKNLYIEDQLNIVYAEIRQTLSDITYKGDVVDFQTLLDDVLKEYNISINESMSFKSLYQLLTIVSISAFVTKDYLKIESFLLQTYKTLQSHKTKEKQTYYHIQVLYLIANTLFRNKKFSISITYLEIMYEHMQLKKRKFFSNFKLKYNLLLALNYNYSNQPEKAVELLKQFIDSNHHDIETLLDIYLSLVTFYFQQGDLKQAKHLFSKFYHTDKWYTEKAGKEWIIKKSLIEILLHLELEHIDLVESKLLSFKRNYFTYLKQINQERVITFLKLIEAYYKTPELVTTSKFKEHVESSFVWVDVKREDIFVMSFYAWLKSKMEKTPIYETTLNLIEKAQNVN